MKKPRSKSPATSLSRSSPKSKKPVEKFVPRDLLCKSPLYESLKNHEAFSPTHNYLVKLWDKEKVIRETLEVVSSLANSVSMDEKLEDFFPEHMLNQNHNKNIVAMTEAMCLLFSLEYFSLFDKEAKFLKELLGVYGMARYHLVYIKMRKNITGLLSKPNTHHTKFQKLILDVGIWSTVLTRTFDQGKHAERTINRIRDKVQMFYEKDCQKRNAPLDSKLKISGLKFMKICLKEYLATTESLQHQNHFKFGVVKRSYTPPPRMNNQNSQQREIWGKRKKSIVVAEFSPIGMREGELVDEASVRRLAILERRRMELRKQLAASLQWVSLHRNNFLIISEYIIQRFNAKYKFIADNAQRVQKLVQPLVNRMERDSKVAHLITPVIQRAVNLVKKKENFPGPLLEAAKKKVGPYNLKMRRDKNAKELALIKNQLELIYQEKLEQNEEAFALEQQFLNLGIPFNPENLISIKNRLDSQVASETVGMETFGNTEADDEDFSTEGLLGSLAKSISEENGGKSSTIKSSIKKAYKKTFIRDEGETDQMSLLSKMIGKTLGETSKKITGSEFGKKRGQRPGYESHSIRSEESSEKSSRDMDLSFMKPERKENDEEKTHKNKKTLDDLNADQNEKGEKKSDLFKIIEKDQKQPKDDQSSGNSDSPPRKPKLNLGQMITMNMRKSKMNEGLQMNSGSLLKMAEKTTEEKKEKDSGESDRNEEAKKEEPKEEKNEAKGKEENPEEANPKEETKEEESPVKRESSLENEGVSPLVESKEKNMDSSAKRRKSSMINFKKALTSIKAKQAQNEQETNKSEISEVESDAMSISSRNPEVQQAQDMNKSGSISSINTLSKNSKRKKSILAALSSVKSKASLASNGSQKNLETVLGETESKVEVESQKANERAEAKENKEPEAKEKEEMVPKAPRRSSLANFKQALTSLQAKGPGTSSKGNLLETVEETNKE